MFFTSSTALGRPNSCILSKYTVCHRQQTVKSSVWPPTAPPKKLFHYYLLTYKMTEKRPNSVILKVTIPSSTYTNQELPIRQLLLVDADCDWRRCQTLQYDGTTCQDTQTRTKCQTGVCESRRRTATPVRYVERIPHTRSCLLQCRPGDDRHRTQFICGCRYSENFNNLISMTLTVTWTVT